MIITNLIIFVLILWVIILSISMVTLINDIERIREDLCVILHNDTNLLLTTSSGKRCIKRLVDGLNAELKVILSLKREYSKGILDLKCSAENVAHDIRTPLTAIKGYVELLKDEEIGIEGRKYLEIISSRVDYMKSLSDELFISLSMKNRGIVKLSPIDAKSVLEEALLSFFSDFRKNSIDPSVITPEGSVMINADSKALYRVYVNIISNSIKYGEGDLRIEMDDRGNTTFSNSAPNMDSVDVNRLLDRYYTINDGKASSGIGLSISKEMVEEMGGRLNIRLEKEILYISIKYELL